MKILLAVDGSDYTRKMLEYVGNHQELFDAAHRYVLLHVQAPLPPHARSALGPVAVQEYHQEEAQRVLAPALASLQQRGLAAESEWKIGPVGDTIAATAREGGYDMLVMGSHGHKALAQLVMGSVSSQVLAQCGVPVLLIR